jgi:hypothetical protein
VIADLDKNHRIYTLKKNGMKTNSKSKGDHIYAIAHRREEITVPKISICIHFYSH